MATFALFGSRTKITLDPAVADGYNTVEAAYEKAILDPTVALAARLGTIPTLPVSNGDLANFKKVADLVGSLIKNGLILDPEDCNGLMLTLIEPPV